jgi:hypothetical protein
MGVWKQQDNGDFNVFFFSKTFVQRECGFHQQKSGFPWKSQMTHVQNGDLRNPKTQEMRWHSLIIDASQTPHVFF